MAEEDFAGGADADVSKPDLMRRPPWHPFVLVYGGMIPSQPTCLFNAPEFLRNHPRAFVILIRSCNDVEGFKGRANGHIA